MNKCYRTWVLLPLFWGKLLSWKWRCLHGLKLFAETRHTGKRSICFSEQKFIYIQINKWYWGKRLCLGIIGKIRHSIVKKNYVNIDDKLYEYIGKENMSSKCLILRSLLEKTESQLSF